MFSRYQLLGVRLPLVDVISVKSNIIPGKGNKATQLLDDKLSYTSSNPLVNVTHGVYCSGRQEKLCLCISSWRGTGEMPAWRADHRACGHSLRAGPRHKVLFCVFFPKYKGQTVKATPPCWTTRCPLAKQWCLCCPMSFSSLQSNVSALNSNESCWECIPVSHSMSRTGLIRSGYCQCPLSLRGRQWAGIPAVVFNPKMRGFPSLRLLAGILRIEGQEVTQILNPRDLPVLFEVLEFSSKCRKKGGRQVSCCAQQFAIARFY